MVVHRVTPRSHILHDREQLGLLGGIRQAFGYLNRRERRRLVVVLAVTVVNALLGLVGLASILPFFQLLVLPDPLQTGSLTGDAFRYLGVTTEFSALMIAGFVVVTLILAKNLFGVLQMRVAGHFSASVETRLASDLLNRIVDSPFQWYLTQNTSILRDVVMANVIEVARGVIRPSLSLFNNGLILIFALGLIIPFTPLPALVVTVVTAGIAFLLMRFARPKIALASRRKRDDSLIAGVAATEAITGGRDVRMSLAGRLLKSEFRKNYSSWAYSDADARQWQMVPRSGIEIIGMTAIVGIALLALLFGLDRLEVASLLALYAVITVRLLPVIGETANSLSQIQIALPGISHLERVRQQLPPQPEPNDNFIPSNWSELSLTGVDFVYAGAESAAVSDVNLVIRRGLSYGVVGSSGAGKSTLADIIAGLLLPTGGQLRVDSLPLFTETALASWRGRVSYVAQSPLIFDMTLAENISLGSEVSDRNRRVAEAIEAAGLVSVVESLENKEHTPIGDRGTRLSGGQRQRVAIARALYQNADLMILDEATSALDSLTEQEVGEAIDSLKGKVTIVAIAHRLSTIMHCDEIILLDRGRIIARGSHAELLVTSRDYKRFVDAQALGRDTAGSVN